MVTMATRRLSTTVGVVMVACLFFIPDISCQNDAAMFTASTPATVKTYNYVWLVTETNSLQFQIKGKSTAHLALAKTPNVYTKECYEIIFGVPNPPNQQFIVRKTINGPNQRISQMQNILSETEFRDFWVTWEGGTISLGIGMEVGVDEKLRWTDPAPFTVTAASMQGSKNTDIQWKFHRDSARHLFLRSLTNNLNSAVWFTEPVRKHFTFGTRACQEVKIGLSDGPGIGAPGQYNTHLIILAKNGNRDVSIIKDQVGDSTAAISASTPGILSCTETRYFWVNWKTGRIQVGKGLTVGFDMFLDWMPSNPHNITSIKPSFGTNSGQNPEYHFRSVEDNYYLLKTESQFDINRTHAISVSGQTSFIFRVHACFDAVLSLQRNPLNSQSSNIRVQIILGTSSTQGEDSLITFIQANGSSTSAQMRSPNLLSCKSFRHLWLGWQNSSIRVGRGEVPYENEVFDYEHAYGDIYAETLHIGSLTEEYTVQWQFDRSQAKTTYLVTSPFLGYDQAWLTSAERKYMYFRVKAEHRVQLLLASYIGNAYVATYTVQISNDAAGDEVTQIWRENKKSGGSSSPTANILSVDTLTPFWVSWIRNRITLGKGVDLDRDVILQFNDGDPTGPLEVNALSFGSPSFSTWQIGTEPKEDAMFTALTPKTVKTYNYVWLVTETNSLQFQIKAKTTAHLALAKTPNVYTKECYEVVIGAADQFIVRKKIKGKNEKVTKMKNILSETEFRDFWVSWEGGTIAVGIGKEIGTHTTLSWVDTDPFPVTAVSMQGSKVSDVMWKFHRDSARHLFLRSLTSNLNSAVWFTEPDRRHFTFGACACQEVKLALSDGPGIGAPGQYNTHLIILATNGNRDVSIIKDQVGDSTAAISASTPDILSCTETRYFWVNWNTGRIQVGKGLTVGNDMFLDWMPTDPHDITSIKPFFGTNSGQNPEYHFRSVEDNYYLLKTESLFDIDKTHAISVSGHTSFIFRVHACYDAVLSLQRSPINSQSSNMERVQIILGSSSTQGEDSLINFIQANGSITTAKMRSPNILSCKSFRHLWLGWHNSSIRVGRGDIPYEDEVFNYPHTCGDLYAETLHIGSLTEEYTVDWQFSQSEAMITSIITSPFFGYDQAWLTSAERRDFYFRVKAEHAVSLLLASYIGNTEVATYNIQISNAATGDEATRIWREGNKTGGSFNPTPGILTADDLKPFWVSWIGKAITLGTGVDLGEHVVLKFNDDDPAGLLEVNALSFGSSHLSTWQIGAEQSPQLMLFTSKVAVPTYDTFWMTPSFYVFPFKVKAEELVFITLTRIPGEVLVEIIIGVNDQTEIHIKGTGINRNVPSPGILNKNELRPLWVSWFNNTVQLGKGTPMQNLLISAELLESLSVGGIGLSSGADDDAEWQFSKEIATEFRIATKDKYSYGQMWLDATDITSQVFRVKAGSNANIALTQTALDITNDIYEITIGRNNNQTVIRKGNHVAGPDSNIKASVYIPSILDSNELQTFWVSWSFGEIRVGRGTEVGLDTILSWFDEDAHSVHAMSIATDEGVEGTWELYRLTEEVYHLPTSPLTPLSPVMTTSNNHIEFSVWGCIPASIVLMEDTTLKPSGYSIYEVVIGTNGDNDVAIYKAKEVSWQLLAEEAYPDVIKCGVKNNFWVGWKDNLLQLGRGSFPHNILVEAEDKTEAYPVNAIAFSNGIRTVGIEYNLQWEISQGAVSGLSFLTSPPETFGNGPWISVYQQEFLVFTVQTCSNATIGLSQLVSITAHNAYRIEIVTGSIFFHFYIYKGSELVQSGERVNIINCNEQDQEYWIGWGNGTIEIGSGVTVGDPGGVKIVYRDLDPHEVKFVGFVSSNDTRWTLHHVQGNVYGHSSQAISDGDRANYEDLWLVPQRHVKAVSFTTKACFDARIALSAEANSLEKVYEVVIAERTSDNVYVSSIRHSMNGQNRVNRTMNGLLDCNHDKSFWVSWDNNKIRLGQGALGSFLILEWHVPLLLRHTVKAVGFGSGSTVNVNWHFGIEQAEAVYGITHSMPNAGCNEGDNDPLRFWLSTRGKEWVVFQVKTCNLVRIYLTSLLYTTPGLFKISLSADSESSIIDEQRNRLLDRITIPGLVNCTRYQTFWMRWGNSTLQVGRGGVVGHGVILHGYNSCPYPINSVGFDGFDKEASWNFLRVQGEVYRTYTSEKLGYGQAELRLDHRTSYSFKVRACANAYMLLSEDSKMQHTLELIIGSYGNTMVELRHNGVNHPVTLTKAEGILSCDQLRSFWISWNDEKIRFGSGDVGSYEILFWKYKHEDEHPMTFAVNYIQVSTLGNDGEWELEQTSSMDACQDSFTKVKDKEDGLASSCFFRAQVSGADLSECFRQTCNAGGNAINYRDTTCNILRCSDPDDLKLIPTSPQPADVYQLDVQRDTFIAKTSPHLGTNYNQHWVSVSGYSSLSFKVKACADVHLALSAVPSNSETLTFEVIIGWMGNTFSAIRKQAGDLVPPVETKSTPGILLCFDFQHLWVSWENGFIKAGKGPVVGEELFIEWQADRTILPINSVGISGSGAEGSDGIFMFGDITDVPLPPYLVEDDKFFLLTDGSGSFTSYRWSLSQDYLLFQLRACACAQLLLVAIPEEYSKGAYRIDIGTEGNRKTSITKVEDTSVRQEKATLNILNCTTPQAFWVKWLRNSIAMGRGYMPGSDIIVTLTDNQMPDRFNEMAVASSNNQEATWDVGKSSGHVFRIVTSNSGRFGEVWRTTRNTDSIVFKVKACSDANIQLSRYLEITAYVYVVTLGMGGNVASGIRSHTAAVREQTEGILSCTEFRAFWIRWYQGIEVGTGTTVGRNPFLRLNEVANHPIEAMSVMTDQGATGIWHFSDISGEGFYLTPAPSAVFGHVWLHTDTPYFQFSVRSCHSAFIFLSPVPYEARIDSPGYEIHIEGDPTAQSQIIEYPREDGKNPIKANVTTQGVINCDSFTPLWMSWKNDLISVGYGEVLKNIFLHYQGTKGFPIRSLALQTPSTEVQKTPSEWQFEREAGNAFRFNTLNGRGFEDWLTVDEQRFTYIRIFACQDAEILLSSTAGVTYGHKIILGKGGERSVIIPAGSTEEVPGREGNPLNCDIGTWFWLTWADNEIAMGHGFDSGSDIVVYYDLCSADGNSFEIGAIGFRSTYSVGSWEFSQSKAREFEVSTSDGLGYRHAWLLTTEQALHFKLQACEKAMIALSDYNTDFRQGVNGSNSYELIIGATENQGIELWKHREGNPEGTLLHYEHKNMDILMCDRFVEFWLVWESQDGRRVFRLGSGPDLYDLEIYNHEDTNQPYHISTVGFASEHSKTAKWAFKDTAAAQTRFHIEGSMKTLYHVAGTTSFVFKVKAAEEATISLAQNYNGDEDYQFILGNSGNRYTVIKAKTEVLINRTSSYVLSDKVHWFFWVSWSHKRLAVGSGSVVGWSEIAWKDVERLPLIQYLRISSLTGVPGDWEYMPLTYNTLLVKTPNNSAETTMSIAFGDEKSDFSFDVRACAEVHLCLMATVYDTPGYELIIGADDNTKTQIRKQGDKVHEETSLDVLNCMEYRTFWLSWHNGIINLGKSSPTGQRLLEWQDTDPTLVHSLSIATGMNNKGNWNIPRDQAPLVRYVSHATHNDEGFCMTVYDLKSYVFRVKAKSNVNILLASIPEYSTHAGYMIEIGAFNNTKTQIVRLSTNHVLEVKPTEGILAHDAFTWFWVAWGPLTAPNTGIKIGKGMIMGEQEFLRANILGSSPNWESVDEIGGICFSASNNNEVTWELMSNTDGNFYMLQTDGLGYDKGAWVAPIDQSFHFEVRACQDAGLALRVDKDGDEGFELILGDLDNTGSVLFQDSKVNDPLATARGRGTVDCGRFKRFWISWSSDVLKVGEGYIDTEPFITYNHHKMIDINVIGFTSDKVSKAEWRIPQEQENALVITTGHNGTYGQHWITLNNKDYVVFRVKACQAAKVLLVAVPDITEIATEIVIGLDGRTVIRDGNGTVKESAPSADVLDCDHFQTFWIDWRDNEINVGIGPNVQQHMLLRHRDENLHDIQAMALGSGDTVPIVAHWQIYGLKGNTIRAFTPAELSYNATDLIAQDPNDFFTTFRVRTCSNARFVISPETRNAEAFEIIMGASSNNRFIITKGGQMVDSAFYPDTLSENHFRSFWVRWQHGNLTIGHGEYVGLREVLNHHDSTAANMSKASYSTWIHCPGRWDIDQRVGDTIVVHTPGEHIYDKIHIMVMDKYGFVFQVKAKSNVHIALSVMPGTTGTETWEIGLQGYNGQYSGYYNFIRNKVNGTIYINGNNRVGFLDENMYKTFWVSWDNGRIALGQTSTVGVLEVVSGNVEDIPHFSSISFCTAAGVPADWKFDITDEIIEATTSTVTTPLTTHETTTTTATPTTTATTTTTTEATTTKGTGTEATTTTTTISTSTSSSTSGSSGTTQKTPTPSGQPSTSHPTAPHSSSTGSIPSSTSRTTTGGQENRDPQGGLDSGQTAGIVIGVIAGVLTLLILVFLLVLRYRPNTLPHKVAAAVPPSVHRAVRRDDVTGHVQYRDTYPMQGGLINPKYGSVEDEPLSDGGHMDT